MSHVVENNFLKMIGNKYGEMQYLLNRESIGGNALIHEGKTCFAANFTFNNETGEIIKFANAQKFGGNKLKATFRCLAYKEKLSISKLGYWWWKRKKKKYSQIINQFLPENISKQAKLVIELSVKKYHKARYRDI